LLVRDLGAQLHDDGKLYRARLTYQKVHVFGRHDIAGNDEAVALPDFFQFLLEDIISPRVASSGCLK
jgi:hypothetical protein